MKKLKSFYSDSILNTDGTENFNQTSNFQSINLIFLINYYVFFNELSKIFLENFKSDLFG